MAATVARRAELVPEAQIPKIIHHIWVGPDPFPAEDLVERWRQMMPGWRIMMWDEGNIDFSSSFIRRAYAVGAYNRVANYARLMALESKGGIYLDHDVELVSGLDGLLENECFVGFQTENTTFRGLVNNAVFGARPGHPFIRLLLARLDGIDGSKDIGAGTGPVLVSDALREVDPSPLLPVSRPVIRAGVTLFPKRFFYPYDFTEDFSAGCITDDTIAIHHWAYSWRQPSDRLSRLRQRAVRLITMLFPNGMFAYRRWHNRLSRSRRTA